MKDEKDVGQTQLEIAQQPARPGFAGESAGLGPLPAGGCVIGVVHGVNDDAARLVSTFVPTGMSLKCSPTTTSTRSAT
jgi:hypothetical protein